MNAVLVTVAAMNVGIGIFKMRRATTPNERNGWLGHAAMAACWMVTEVQRAAQ